MKMRFLRKFEGTGACEGNWILKNKILFNQDYRGKSVEQARIRYCSVFRSNLSGVTIDAGGDFTGNGWNACSFFGAACRNVCMDMEQYEQCILGNTWCDGCSLWEITAENCNYAGIKWINTTIEGCTFRDCNFRNAQFLHSVLQGNRFVRCVFDDAVFSDCELERNVWKDCILNMELES